MRPRYVVAPNPFKGSLGAPAAAAAMARGLRRAFSDADVLELPVADGGEGTVEALIAARGGRRVEVEVPGPRGAPVAAAFGLIDGGRTAVVELAAASGLTLISQESRDPRVTSTEGFGRLLAAARGEGARKVIAGIGGSATNDGGAGLARALGYRLLDRDGAEIAPGGAALARLDRIDATHFDAGWRQVTVEVACDVTNPLTGPEGASAVYGPQKGATPAMVAELDAALGHFAAVVRRDLGVEVEHLPGAGAAGGAGAGLVAFLGARLVRGAPLVVEAARLDEALDGATACLTGEGRIDAQTAFGKGPAEVAERCRRSGVPVAIVAGSRGDGWERLGVPVVALADGKAAVEDLIRDPGPWLEEAAVKALRELAG